MRLLSALFIAAVSLPLAVEADPVVVELFTAQGCSSCPPADAMLGKLAARDDVIALSLHVDYWDWIGWSDTFASPAMSERQRAYAEAHGSSTLFTPQFVVDGDVSVAGANPRALERALAGHAAGPDVLRVEAGGQGPVLHADTGGAPATLILVRFVPSEQVEVTSGENAGLAVTYYNVVRDWVRLADWDGRATTIPLPPGQAGLSRAVLAQSTDGKAGSGPILGAVRVD